MYIHLTPSFYHDYSDVSVELIDISIPECGLVLKNNEDITVRFPVPNKRIHYVCRKKGRKAMYGILLDTDKPVSDITVITRWKVQDAVSVHRVHMHFEGSDDAATDCIQLWMGRMFSDFRSKTPACAQDWIPASCQPRLTVAAGDRLSVRDPEIWRKADSRGIIREQNEFFTAATVEPERLFSERSARDRIPSADDAFRCTVREYGGTVKPLFKPGFPPAAVCTLREHESLLREDFNESGLSNEFAHLMKPVLDELSGKCLVFFSNTTDLMNMIKTHSSIYAHLSDERKQFVRSQISIPLIGLHDTQDRPPQS